MLRGFGKNYRTNKKQQKEVKMKKTFFKNALSTTQLVISGIFILACIVFGILYSTDMTLRFIVSIGGIVLIILQNIWISVKNDMFKRLKVTDEYIQVNSFLNEGFKIYFKDVLTAGKLSMATTKTSHERYFFSTVKYTKGEHVSIDKSNTIDFDRTPKTEGIFDYICEKHNLTLTEF